MTYFRYPLFTLRKESAIYKLDRPEETQPIPRFVPIVIGVLIVGTIILVILIGSKKPDSSTHTGSIEFVKVTQEVLPSQNEDIVIGVNNATLYVPKGATTVPGIISITTSRKARQPCRELFPLPRVSPTSFPM